MTDERLSTQKQLLKFGLDCADPIPNDVIWETPVKLHRGVRVRNTEIGAYSYIAPGTEIHGVTIGRYCSIGPKTNMLGSSHPTQWLSSHPFTHVNIFETFVEGSPTLEFERKPKRTFIGHDVWIGLGVIVIPGVRIGNGAVIGAGAVVSRDVPDYAVVVGNPARVVKYRFEPTLIARLADAQWWHYDMPRSLSTNPDLPLDQPVAMLDFMERSPDLLIPLAPERRHIQKTSKGFAIRQLPPLSMEAAGIVTPSQPL